MALVERDETAARALLQSAGGRSKTSASRDLALLAVLAARLGSPAPPLPCALRRFVPAANENESAFAAALTTLYGPDDADSQLAFGAVAPAIAIQQLSSVIREIAPLFNRRRARTALERMKTLIEALPSEAPVINGARQDRTAWAGTYAQSARRVVSELSDKDAALARSLARDVAETNNWNGPAAKISAAALGTPQERIAQAHEALEADSRGQAMRADTAARLGALIYNFDPE